MVVVHLVVGRSCWGMVVVVGVGLIGMVGVVGTDYMVAVRLWKWWLSFALPCRRLVCRWHRLHGH